MTSLRKNLLSMDLSGLPEPSDNVQMQWLDDRRVVLTDGDFTLRATVFVDRDATHVCVNGRTHVIPNDEGGRAAGGPAGSERAATSPMTGLLAQVHVSAGDEVAAGAPLFVVEAMKMEYVVRAPRDVTVAAVNGEAGAQIDLGAEVVTFVEEEEASA